MGATSIWHWIIVLLVVLLLFGRGRIAPILGDIGKGIHSLKEGLKGDDKSKDTPKTLSDKDRD